MAVFNGLRRDLRRRPSDMSWNRTSSALRGLLMQAAGMYLKWVWAWGRTTNVLPRRVHG